MTYSLPKSNNRENPRVSPFVQLALCTFGIIVLELAIIRWMSSQIRIVAYFSNVVLLASFLGMGLGIALGRRRPLLPSGPGCSFLSPGLLKAKAVLVEAFAVLNRPCPSCRTQVRPGAKRLRFSPSAW